MSLIMVAIRATDEGWMAELGPMRIPLEVHRFTKALIERFKLQVAKFQTANSYMMIHLRLVIVEQVF